MGERERVRGFSLPVPPNVQTIMKKQNRPAGLGKILNGYTYRVPPDKYAKVIGIGPWGRPPDPLMLKPNGRIALTHSKVPILVVQESEFYGVPYIYDKPIILVVEYDI